MDQIKRLLSSFTTRQKITIAVVAIAVVAGVMYFARWQREHNLKPLFTTMSPDDAGSVIAKLKERNIDYRVSENGGTILVPAERVAELRLEMASAGLPKSGRIGFELFDKTTFGVTEFTEHINYRRAVEGELERSIASISEVEQARVHLTFPKDSVFTEAREPAKASVLLRLRAGARLANQNVAAISHLVASAVEGLRPESVSIMDVSGRLFSRPKPSLGVDGAPSEAMLDYQQKVERDLIAKVSATLEPLLGTDHFRVGMSVDCDFTTGEQSDETFDPTKSVMVTSQKTEDEQTSSSSGSGGVPGTASNLPRATAPASGKGSGSSRRTENVTYQTSRSTRHIKLAQGTVKRLSASVLLDQAIHWEKRGNANVRVATPHAPEKIKTIKDLVATAIGMNPTRGDQLTIESLAFEANEYLEPPAPTNAPEKKSPTSLFEQVKNDPRLLAIAGVAGAALLLLTAFSIILMLKRRSKGATAAAAATATAALQAGMPQPQLEPGMALALPAGRIESMVGQLRKTATADAQLCAAVLSGWLNEHKNTGAHV